MYRHQHNGIYPFVGHWFSIIFWFHRGKEMERVKTWCSNARWREGRKRSNSKGVLVAGLIKSASFLAFTNISSPLKQTNWWEFDCVQREEWRVYLQGIIQSANVAIFSVDQIDLWEETTSPIWNQDIFLEVLLLIPLCGVLMVRQCSSGQQGWLNTNPMATKNLERGYERRLHGCYLVNSQLLFCCDDQPQEGVLLIPKSFPCKSRRIPRVFRIKISKSFFQGRIIFPQFLCPLICNIDGVLCHWIPIWCLKHQESGKKQQEMKRINNENSNRKPKGKYLTWWMFNCCAMRSINARLFDFKSQNEWCNRNLERFHLTSGKQLWRAPASEEWKWNNFPPPRWITSFLEMLYHPELCVCVEDKND